MKLFIAAALIVAAAAPSTAFEISFDWGDIPRCTSGNPGRVSSPTFVVTDAPAGTAAIKFALSDQDAPDFSHGGGTGALAGGQVAGGSFKYLSPCPPNGTHTYKWSATALDGAGAKLGTASAKKQYP